MLYDFMALSYRHAFYHGYNIVHKEGSKWGITGLNDKKIDFPVANTSNTLLLIHALIVHKTHDFLFRYKRSAARHHTDSLSSSVLSMTKSRRVRWVAICYKEG